MANTNTEVQLVAELNDLLQLDHDAMQAYALAIEGLSNQAHRETLRRFRGDHERHVQNLSELIEAHGGTPVQLPHIPSGPMKLAVQAVGNTGGDREVLLAFKSNERQVRDKYQRLADGTHSPDVAAVLNRNAADEERHYAWVSQVLDEMGAGRDTRAGAAAEVLETAHGRTADVLEKAERQLMAGAESIRQSRASALLLGVVGGVLLGRLFR